MKIEGAIEVRAVVFPDGTKLWYNDATGRVEWDLASAGAAAPVYTQTFATADRTHAAPTAVNPAAVTEYTPHAAGATAVTSNAGTDLDTTAAALNTLVDECQVLETELSALIVDVADVKQLVNSVIDDLQALGLFL